MQRASEDGLRPIDPVREENCSTISLVTTHEISETLKASAPSEADPEGMSLAKLLNLLLLSRTLPKVLRRARTVLVPKVSNPAGPDEYRPIAIGPMFVSVPQRLQV